MSNVFLTTLSLPNKNYSKSQAVYGGEMLQYIMQQRPGFEFSQRKLGYDKKFDRIVVLCSPEASANDGADMEKLVDGYGSSAGATKKSVYEAFVYQITNKTVYADSNGFVTTLPINDRPDYKEADFIKIDQQTDGSNFKEILDAIEKDPNGCVDTDINLYIDVQGGQRSSNVVVQSLLTIAADGATNITISSILAGFGSFGKPFEYKDVQKEFRIVDLVSGVNAFLKYGKADLLRSYCKKVDIRPKTPEYALFANMIRIDEAISVCNTKALVDEIEKIWEKLTTEKYNPPFDYIAGEIRKEYEKVITDTKADVVKLIRWAVEKQFYQQALTLVESILPKEAFVADTFFKIKAFNEDWARNNDGTHFKEVPEIGGQTDWTSWEFYHYIFKVIISGNYHHDKNGNETLTISYQNQELSLTKKRSTIFCSENKRAGDFFNAYSMVKDVRNKINHASSNMEDKIKTLFIESLHGDVENYFNNVFVVNYKNRGISIEKNQIKTNQIIAFFIEYTLQKYEDLK